MSDTSYPNKDKAWFPVHPFQWSVVYDGRKRTLRVALPEGTVLLGKVRAWVSVWRGMKLRALGSVA